MDNKISKFSALIKKLRGKNVLILASVVFAFIVIGLVAFAVTNRVRAAQMNKWLSEKDFVTDTNLSNEFFVYTFGKSRLTIETIKLSPDQKYIEYRFDDEMDYQYSVNIPLFGKTLLKLKSGSTTKKCAISVNNDGEITEIQGLPWTVMKKSEIAQKLNSYDQAYAQGTCTTTRFYSEWLGLQFDLPYSWKMIDPVTVANRNKNAKDIIEMSAYENNTEQSPRLQIAVEEANGKTAAQVAETFKNNLTRSFKEASADGFDLQAIWQEPYEYTLCGEKYLVYAYHYSTYYNNRLQRSGNTWVLFRKKADRIISINCSDISGDEGALENILQSLKAYN